VDLFDAERDRFPYDDGSFETVLACELIEHLLRDPMHFLMECGRVLQEGGRLLLTTPNASSLTSVARALHGYENPQVYSLYHRPRADAPAEFPHVREYTPFELQDALQAGGFAIESLFTEPIAGFEGHRAMWNFLERSGYNNSLRGAPGPGFLLRLVCESRCERAMGALAGGYAHEPLIGRYDSHDPKIVESSSIRRNRPASRA
jgi:SAM-dependent methyltransferase